MTEHRLDIIRTLLIISFLLLMITTLMASVYFIFGSAYASVYGGGGEISWLNIIWVWKGIVTTFIFSVFAFLGLRKPNKLGVFFSYSIAIGLGLYFLITFVNSTFYQFRQGVNLDVKYIFGLVIAPILIIGIAWLLILGTRKVELAYFQFKKTDYGIICGLSLILILSWYFMFRFYW